MCCSEKLASIVRTFKVLFFQVRNVMVSSKLATGVLGKIWDLSDVDRDGMLDQYEFTVAMHLVFRALQGDKIPDQLPPELSPEKVPGSLSALPNLNGTAKPPAAATPQVRFYNIQFRPLNFILLTFHFRG